MAKSEILDKERNGSSKQFNIAVPKFLVQLPNQLQNCIKASELALRLRRFDLTNGF